MYTLVSHVVLAHVNLINALFIIHYSLFMPRDNDQYFDFYLEYEALYRLFVLYVQQSRIYI